MSKSKVDKQIADLPGLGAYLKREGIYPKPKEKKTAKTTKPKKQGG